MERMYIVFEHEPDLEHEHRSPERTSSKATPSGKRMRSTSHRVHESVGLRDNSDRRAMSVPEHPLPCGHVICHACLKAFGKPVGRSTVAIHSCPLHNDETRWARPKLIQLKPKGAGVRVLSLDGGGTRGRALLEFLRVLQEQINLPLPIQQNFDLVFDTSSGVATSRILLEKHRS